MGQAMRFRRFVIFILNFLTRIGDPRVPFSLNFANDVHFGRSIGRELGGCRFVNPPIFSRVLTFMRELLFPVRYRSRPFSSGPP
jgi:hypothetical protein